MQLLKWDYRSKVDKETFGDVKALIEYIFELKNNYVDFSYKKVSEFWALYQSLVTFKREFELKQQDLNQRK